ncbi:MAG TPA: PAS domain S-box protein [Rhizomicrobium sp.]
MKTAERIDTNARARGTAESTRLAELEAVMESAPAAILVTRDPDCAEVTGNAAAYALFRRPAGSNLSLTPQGPRAQASFELRSDGHKLGVREMPLRRAAAGELVRDCEIGLHYADGTSRHIRANATPLRDNDGRIYGAVAVFLDITERKRASEAQEHLASIVEYSDDAIISKDLNGIILSWNRGAELLFGYTAEEAVGRPVTILIPESRMDEEPDILARIRSGERIDHYETVRRRKDGTLVDISLTVSPMRDGKGQIVAASKIARNISEQKHAEAQRNLLMAELNHRVKNTLATVISIARQSFAGTTVAAARSAFDARIRGLAHTHGRLADTSWESVGLEMLLEDELAPYRHGERRNFVLEGPPAALSPRCALTLGLAVHELATNAAKYGALSTDSGTVDVRWRIEPRDQALAIEWTEHGGPPVAPPTRSGFGRLLLERALVTDLKSEVHLDFPREGFSCRIRIPAAQCQARA